MSVRSASPPTLILDDTEDAQDWGSDTKIDEIINNPNLSPEQVNLLKTFPWMGEFLRACQAEIGIVNMRGLEKHMRMFQRLALPSIRECYSRPNRAAKLKRLMSDVLLFFHMTYSEFKSPLEHSSYLGKMSDLCAMYLDMEIKSSRTGTESVQKIASKLTSCLIVYFGKSHDYIIDTVLKAKIITKTFGDICDLIFRRVLRDSPSQSRIHIFSYIRYLFAFKMWKGITKGGEERKKITKLATIKLEPPSGFRETMSSEAILRELLPRVPKGRTDITGFFMQAKFSVRDKIKLFLKAVQDPKLQCALDRQNFSTFENASSLDGSVSNGSSELMNDFWSSLNIDAGIHDPLKPNFIRLDGKNKKTKSLVKLKVDQARKRRKKIEIIEDIGEDDSPISESLVVENNFMDTVKLDVAALEMVKEEPVLVIDEKETVEPMEVASEVELTQVDPEESLNLVKDTEESLNLVKDSEESLNLVKDNSLKQAAQSQSWNDLTAQTYYNNLLTMNCIPKDTSYGPAEEESSDSFLKLSPMPKEDEHIDLVEETVAGEVMHESEEVIDNSIPLVEEVVKTSEPEPTELLAEAAQSCTMDTMMEQQAVGVNMLHDYTVRSDSKMYEFQQKVYSCSSKLNARTWINLLSPLFCQQSKLKMYRCYCTGCKNNLYVIRMNWKSVMTVIMVNGKKSEEDSEMVPDEYQTYESSFEDLKAMAEGEKGDILYWEAEIGTLLKKLDEITKEESESSSLPLKKRKAFSASTSSAGGPSYSNPVISYPSTPMISIAELAEKAYPTPAQKAYVPPPAYPSYPVYGAVADPKYNTVIVQTAAGVLPDNPVPGVYTATYYPKQDPLVANKKLATPEEVALTGMKFRTPAQLKEFNKDLYAAQDLINFAESSRKYSKSQTRKVSKPSRKRKKRD